MGKTAADALVEITKIGNFAIPTFGAAVTASLALSPVIKGGPNGYTLIVLFALYTIFAAYTSYWHRLRYLRYSAVQKIDGKDLWHLPTWEVVSFMLVHFFLIIGLIVCICIFDCFQSQVP